MKKYLVVLALVLCASLYAQVPDSLDVPPGRLLIRVASDFTTIGDRGDGVIITEQPWFNALAPASREN